MWYIKLYKKSQTLLAKSYIASQSLFNGFWLGVLNYQNLHKIDEIYYNDAEVYCSAEYNKKGLKEWEQAMIENYFQDCSTLLLIGAGGGREIYSLQKMGYSVEAFECNPKLLNFGNKFLTEEGLTPCIIPLARDEIPQSQSECDGVVIGWGAYMLIQGKSRRISFLKKLRPLIKNDGKILLSFLTRPNNSRELQMTTSVGNIFRFLLRRERLHVGDTLVPYYIHYFTEKEMSEELSQAGFEMLYYSRKPYGHAVGAVKNKH